MPWSKYDEFRFQIIKHIYRKVCPEPDFNALFLKVLYVYALMEGGGGGGLLYDVFKKMKAAKVSEGCLWDSNIAMYYIYQYWPPKNHVPLDNVSHMGLYCDIF